MSKTIKKVSIAITTFFAFLALTFGAMFMVKPAMAEVNTNFVMNEKASVRIDGTKGIRFLVDVNNEYLENLTKEGAYAGYTASLHVAIIPTTMLGGAELNATTQYVYNAENVETLIIDLKNSDLDNSTATVTRYNASLMNIPNVSYETSISARGFIKLEKDGAQTEYIYTDNTAVRAMGEVATACVNDATADPAKREAAKALLESNLGTISFAEESITLENGASVEVEVCGNKYGFVLDEKALMEKEAVITSDSANVTVDGYTITGVFAGTANITVTIGEKTDTIPVTVKDVAYKTDATNTFRWKEDSTTSVTKTNAGYVLKGGDNTTVEYLTTVGVPDGDIITLYPTSTANIPEAIRIDFTDATDASKGFSFYLYNGLYSGSPCTYSNVLNLSDANPAANVGAPLANASVALGAQGAMMKLYWAKASFAYRVYVPSSGSYYTPPNNTLSANPFVSNSMKVSITLYGTNANQEIGVSMIAGNKFDYVVKQDATNTFSWKDDGITNVTKASNGYVLKGGNGTKIEYLTTVGVPDGDIITLYPTSTANLPEAIRIDFTDATDASKGFSFYLYNGVYSGSPCTYSNVLNLSDANPAANVGAPLANSSVALGVQGAMMKLYWAKASFGYRVYVPSSGTYYTPPNHTLNANPLVSDKVKVSITLYGTNANQEIGVSMIAGNSFITA